MDWSHLVKHIIEGKIQEGIAVTGRRGRKRKQLLDVVKETRGYCKEAIGRTLWRNHFGRSYVPVIETDYGMNEYHPPLIP
jgi:hypothetical protein